MDYSKLFRLDGRAAVVVGAGSGIGQEAARGLAGAGATVICADIMEAAARETAGSLPAGVAYHLDARDPEAVARAAAEYADAEILVFTTGMNVRKRLLDYQTAEFDRVVDLNLRAAFEMIRAFGANMVARGRGSIIGFSSIRSLTTEPGQGVYAATKAALVMLARTAAAEFGPSGVRVNVVAPGPVDTPLTAPIKADREWWDAYASKGALGRWGRAEEMAGAVIYLASDAASYVTGSVLLVDGGWTAVDGRFSPPA
ncbi:MAG TPA: SDR family oxidoreductase [Trebonia sp.]|jgi:NAD(P)-dependent dehydrogenase (short-subunit alcohol dehydrogenase family)|nr:SDR family oxidoreductase [Trebonia sp.]